MRKITEILRLKFGLGLSMRAVALSLNVGYGTVANYIKRAEAAGLDWPLPPDIDDRSLGRLLFPSTGATAHSGFIDLDYLSIYQELKSPIVSMAKIIDPLLAINFDPPSRVISCQISVLVDNFLLPA